MSCIPPKPIADLPRKVRIRSPLHQAIIDGRMQHFRLLVEKLAANVNAKDVYGWTPLTLCCLIDNEIIGLRCMQILTSKGVNINEQDVLLRTPLHYCCIGGKQRLARHLINGFEALDVHIRDCYGFNPLMYAAMRGRPGIVRLITKHYVSSSISVDDRDSRGRTPLMIACSCGNYVSAHILLTVGNAGKNRRDDVFFRSSAEWVEEAEATKVEDLIRENNPLARLTVPLNSAVGYDRRMTRLLRLPKMAAMYDRDKPFTCQHKSRTPWRYTECFNELVRGIPEMFTHFHVPPTGEEEELINGENSCRVLLAALEDPVPPVKSCRAGGELSPVNSAMISVETSHISMAGSGASNSRISPPAPPPPPLPTRCISTPRLIELRQNQDRMMVPDLATLFRMYVPRDPTEKRSDLTEKRSVTRQDVLAQDQKGSTPAISNAAKVVHLEKYH